jgi:hypothetical protein
MARLIYEDWALCQLLINHGFDLAGLQKYHAEPDTLAQPSKINLVPMDRVLVIGRSWRHGQIIGNHITEPVHAYNWQLIGGCILAYVINTTSPCFSNGTSWCWEWRSRTYPLSVSQR